MSQVLALLLLLLSINCYGAIGKVTEEKGNAEIVRLKTKIGAKINSGVESNDTIQTVNGVIGITFEDDTKVRVTEHSKLVIDDFVYDPKSKGAGKLAMKVALGTVRYASGAVAKDNAKNVAINTPTATIAVRGTAFTMTVDEIGQSMIILLPNIDGSVGEIEVSTAMGSVVLNQAFQATMTTGAEIKPLRPVLLNLSESAIDNMLIVKPPKEIIKQIMEENAKSFDALAFTELDKNALDIKVFVDDLKYNELNINELDTNYLTNALDTLILNAFQVGYNAITQLYVFDKSSNWQLDRHIRHDFTMIINKERGYDITLIQDGTTLFIKNMDNTSNKTIIKQGAK
jgi:hypothetical protein